MFTAKIKGGDEITVNLEPEDFVWMRYCEFSGEYTYQYPNVPTFVTSFKIETPGKHTLLPPAPKRRQDWVIIKSEWSHNGIGDDFFGLNPGDIVTVTQIEKYDDGEWCAFVKVDERMSFDKEFAGIGEEIAFFTHEQVALKVIAPL